MTWNVPNYCTTPICFLSRLSAQRHCFEDENTLGGDVVLHHLVISHIFAQSLDHLAFPSVLHPEECLSQLLNGQLSQCACCPCRDVLWVFLSQQIRPKTRSTATEMAMMIRHMEAPTSRLREARSPIIGRWRWAVRSWVGARKTLGRAVPWW